MRTFFTNIFSSQMQVCHCISSPKSANYVKCIFGSRGFGSFDSTALMFLSPLTWSREHIIATMFLSPLTWSREHTIATQGRLHVRGERNIDAVESKLPKPRLPKIRSQRCVKGLSAWSPLMLSAVLAAKPPKTKSHPATKEFIINLDDSSNSEEASEEE